MDAGGAKATEDALLQASRYAGVYFERFDKSNLHHAAVHRETDWLLSPDQAQTQEPRHCVLLNNLPKPDANGR